MKFDHVLVYMTLFMFDSAGSTTTFQKSIIVLQEILFIELRLKVNEFYKQLRLSKLSCHQTHRIGSGVHYKISYPIHEVTKPLLRGSQAVDFH